MITYEAIINKAKSLEADGLPFVIFRNPQSDIVQLLYQHDDDCHFFNYTFDNEGFVLAPFRSEQGAPIFIKSEAVLQATYQPDQNFSTPTDENLSYDHDEKLAHNELIEKAIREIDRGTLEKVVISRKITLEKAVSPIESFQKMLSRYHSAFCYLFSHPKVGTWLAATPETLLKFENQTLTTMALAGTQSYHEGEKPEWTQKEKDEQQIVTNVIVRKIHPHVEQLTVSKPKTVRAAGVVHLCTDIQAEISDSNTIFTILRDLHPTPAVCGFPNEAARQFIVDNEAYDRSFYTGYCGVIGTNQTAELYVNLRCMQINKNQTYIYVGGGIIRESNADSEWDETQNKAMTMYAIIREEANCQ
ncbi:MAG: isochorismate synthase [Capnocytophaga sp.]|nr:isochorismate synthase [Capnocytophaga sp.]